MKKIKTRARAKSPAESEIQNPCERFFIFIFSVYQNQIAEALPASKRTPTDSLKRETHRQAPLNFPLADSTPVTRGEPFETQGDQPVIYHLSLAHRKSETIFLRHQQASPQPTVKVKGGRRHLVTVSALLPGSQG